MRKAGLVREPLAIPLREAKPPLVLALDVGTSGLRSFLFDVAGRPVASAIAHRDRPVRTSIDGEASLDADERLRATASAIDAPLAPLAVARRVHVPPLLRRCARGARDGVGDRPLRPASPHLGRAAPRTSRRVERGTLGDLGRATDRPAA